MLRQEINLYQFLKPQSASIFLTRKQLGVILLLFSCLLFLQYLILLRDLHQLRNIKVSTQNEIALLQQQFQKIKNAYPDSFVTGDVKQSLEKLKTQLVVEQKVFEKLSTYSHSIFSNALLALSTSITPNVWVTSIIISNSGYELTIKGKSISLDNVKLFMEKISHNSTFSNYILNIKNIEKQNDTVVFDINLVNKII